MDNKDAYIEHLENIIKDLQNQVSNLTEMIALMRKDKYGSSSEKTSRNDFPGQLSFFDEAETEADATVLEPIQTSVKGYTRINQKTKREEIIKDLPVREVLCTAAEEDMACPSCGTVLKPIGKETVREELEYIPAKLQIVRYVRMAYECPNCKHTDTPYILKANSPTSLMNHSLASPSSVANVMYQKYVNAVPLYRQEKAWENLGIALSRALRTCGFTAQEYSLKTRFQIEEFNGATKNSIFQEFFINLLLSNLSSLIKTFYSIYNL